MKKVTILLIMLFGIANAFCQNTLQPINPSSYYYRYDPVIMPMRYTIFAHNWSDPGFFAQSSKPLLTGYGEFSDSLSKIYQGKTFFAHGDNYYLIETWADYYFWLTKKYSHKFKNPELYEYYYISGNDERMVSYLQGSNYLDNVNFSILRFDFREIATSADRFRRIPNSTQPMHTYTSYNLSSYSSYNLSNELNQRVVIHSLPAQTQTINTSATITADE
jgi:hypothetical protein